jgi:hypothetical protein
MPFFPTKCAPFLLKIGENFTLIIKKGKGLELMKIVLMTHLSTFGRNIWFKSAFNFENYGF